MDPTELIKAAPEIAKGLTAVGAAIPFTGIVKKMPGTAADEVAEILRDRVRLYIDTEIKYGASRRPRRWRRMPVSRRKPFPQRFCFHCSKALL
jgi:hypothetical protein